MNKITKKSIKRRNLSTFPVINSNVAGIDVGDREIVVGISEDRYAEPIKTFGTFTCDLHEIARHLLKCKIKSVAVESTGVYWVALYLILEDYGIEVYLVNAKHVKNVTGRKDDESDAAWLCKLHRCGLLNRSFQPSNEIRAIRSLVRHRKNLIKSQSSHVNRIIKTMELMNIKLHTVISDILGKSGMNILRAIIEKGIRDAEELSKLTDYRIKASKEQIIKSLEGDWREEHLFELKQYYDLYHYYQGKIEEVDKKIEEELLRRVAESNDGDITLVKEKAQRKASKVGKNEYYFDAGMYIEKITGVNPTDIFSINGITSLEIFSEVGTDMSKWRSAKHFVAWLNVAPNNKISGGKLISSKIMKKKHRAGQAFRMAANSLWNSKNDIGDYFRRIKYRSGTAKAIVASARKLATIYYMMMSKKEKFNPKLLCEFQEKYKLKKIKNLKRQLAELEAA